MGRKRDGALVARPALERRLFYIIFPDKIKPLVSSWKLLFVRPRCLYGKHNCDYNPSDQNRVFVMDNSL